MNSENNEHAHPRGTYNELPPRTKPARQRCTRDPKGGDWRRGLCARCAVEFHSGAADPNVPARGRIRRALRAFVREMHKAMTRDAGTRVLEEAPRNGTICRGTRSSWRSE